MAKILSVGELLAAARAAQLPNYEAHEENLRTAAHLLAAALATHLDIVLGDTTSEGLDVGGLCASFYAKDSDQPLPDALAEVDEGGDWEPRGGGVFHKP